ncbi:MAG: MBL fold metallo-hydrolase [Proteobacteria bacterium]|nr:MBL fold metallo-hydrolase [Pseudomonadota bacterium]
MTPITYPFDTPPKIGEAIEVADGVLWLRLPLPMALDHVNIFALRDGDGWCVIDSGYYSKDAITLWQDILRGALGGLPITRLILTHHHPDHVGMMGWLQTTQNARLYTSRTAWLYSRMMTLDVCEVWSQQAVAFYRTAGVSADMIAERTRKRPFNFADCVYPMPLGFHRLDEGDILSIGSRDWQVRLGGGHAPDQVTLWSQSDNLVIAGDQVLPTISPNIGVYPTEPLADPLTDWLASCESFRRIARDNHFVLCGHKLPFIGLPARLGQLIDNHHGALARLMDFLRVPNTAVGCFDVLYKRSIKDGEFGLALAEALAHLNHLYLAGKITRELDEDGVLRFFASD